MRAVIDTNVLLSGLLWRGAPHALIEQARAGALTLITSPALLAELHGIARRPKFRQVLARSATSPELMVREVLRLAELVDPPSPPAPVVARDPDDDHVIAAALAAKAELIVSGDRHLLDLASHQGIRIVTPGEALRIVAP